MEAISLTLLDDKAKVQNLKFVKCMYAFHFGMHKTADSTQIC